MGQATFTPRQVARLVADATGRECDAKRVRAWVRDNVARFDDDGYTAHAYTLAECQTIVDGLTTRKARGESGPALTLKDGRVTQVPQDTDRTPRPVKARAMGSGPVQRVKVATAPQTAPTAPGKPDPAP